MGDLQPILGRLCMVEGDGGLMVGWVRSLVRRAVHQHKAERCLVVVDYLLQEADSFPSRWPPAAFTSKLHGCRLSPSRYLEDKITVAISPA